ncbi:substrate-binding domain-containing protein [Pseudochelatococcus contaminans]|uniref:Phosphate transport system substrate-binding protein n=1 Tax=Pseudochelatococcus contaminans TaxID=1538103 RepID=A0A7W6EGV6_9HYPH|nr:substrate-binding domain-containing protein [Pseudochelatococcus contaminans]MBB3809691.1 phosphate transport system substrate-binding protein [Pseudochelatococcus contaminans]
MKNALKVSVAALAIAGVFSATGAIAQQNRDTIQIAGSSTVLPFASIVAEEFSAANPQFKTPVVASGGSGGGLRQFCEGVGPATIDIANASRRIRAGEVETCNKNGVNDIREVRIGYDGIVFAVPLEKGDFALEPVHIYKAIADKLYVDGKWVANPNKTWKDVDASLPDQPIVLAIPAPNHGTREVFEERVIAPGFKASNPPADAPKEAQSALRQDVVVEIAGDYTETLARLKSDPNTVGVFGLSFYDQNRDSLKVATVSGVEPTLETIAKGEYPVSRPLFFYVKGEHVGVIPGINEYVEFFLSDDVAGEGGRLESAGLIPAPKDETAAVLEAYKAGTKLTADDVK